jgi:soluble lytic murein transglycosylase-like protein
MSDLVQMAKDKAKAVGLDPALVCAICEQESSWNPWAVRFEPAFYSRYIVPMKGITATEAYTRAMSFGLMQTMGEVCRELHFTGPYLTEICDPETSLDYGCKKLRRCLDATGGNIPMALLRYNGGSNTSYPQEVQAKMAKYQ